MASTYSDLKVELIGTGEQTGTWGTTTNNNLSIALGEAITGSADVVFAGSDVTLTLTDTNAAQTARNLRLNLTGTSGGARNLILGSGCQIEKLYLINNGLADAVTIKNTTGNGVAVPAGRSMFVFNNGTDVVEASSGDIFGPASSTLNAVPTFADTTGNILQNNSGVTISSNTVTASGGFSTAANLTFTGTGNRITGDMTNATLANRVAFQTSTANTTTILSVIPNGTGTASALQLYNNSSDLANSSVADLRVSGTTDVRLQATFNGTGTQLPLTMYTGGSERLRIDTSGNVGIGTSSPGSRLTVVGNIEVRTSGGIYFGDSTNVSFPSIYSPAINNIAFRLNSGSETMRIDSSGNVGIGTSSPAYKVNAVVTSGADAFFADGNAQSFSGYRIRAGASGQQWAFRGGNTTMALTDVTAGADRLVIDSSGNVGIGTSSPATLLQVNTSASDANVIRVTGGSSQQFNIGVNNSNGGPYVFTTSNHGLRFGTNDTERMRIDSSGNLLVGTTTVQSSAANRGNITVGGSAGAIVNLANASSRLGYIFHDGTNMQVNNNTNGYMNFYTNDTERMRIDSSGNLLVGTTSQVATSRFSLNRSDAGNVAGLRTVTASGTVTMVAFLDGDSQTCGTITIDATANTTAYNTSSDYRLKENVAPMTGALQKLSELKPCTWNWKHAPEVAGQGFIAHELAEVCPDAVTGEKDGEQMQGVDYGKITPLLTAALQEALAKIESLEARLAALESK